MVILYAPELMKALKIRLKGMLHAGRYSSKRFFLYQEDPF